MATQPVLQGETLPWPRNPGGYAERRGQRAVSLETANSNLVFQRLTTTAKREFVLVWAAISNSEYATINTAYDLLLSSPTTSNFTAPTGTTYTVTPAQNNPPLDAEYTETPAGGVWDVQMRLREISAA